MEKTPRNFILDNMLCMSAYWACTGTVIASLTGYFGFSIAVSNVVTGLTGTMLMLQIAGSFAYGRTAHPLRFLRVSNGLWRVLLPICFFSVLLPKNAGAPLMLVCYLLGIGIYQFACPPQTAWMIGAVEDRVKNDYYSVREMFFMILYTVLFCAVGLIIDRGARTGTQRMGFFVIGIAVAVLLAASLVVLMRLPAPMQPKAKKPPLRAFLEPLRNRAFRRVMVAYMMWSFSSMFIGGFAAVYQIRVLGLSFFTIMLWTTVGNLSRSFFTPIMARIARRFGWKTVAALTTTMMAFVAVLWIMVTKENVLLLYPILSVLGTIPYAGMGVSYLQMQVATSPREQRSVYLSVYATLSGASALLGSTLCSVLISVLAGLPAAANGGNLRLVFAVGIVGALLTVLLVLRVSYVDANPEKQS